MGTKWLLGRRSLAIRPRKITKLSLNANGRSAIKFTARNYARKQNWRKNRSASKLRNVGRSARLSARRKKRKEPEGKSLKNRDAQSVNVYAKSSEPLTSSGSGRDRRDMSDADKRIGRDIGTGSVIVGIAAEPEIVTATVIGL